MGKQAAKNTTQEQAEKIAENSEPRTDKKNLPIIIAAIFSGFLLISMVVVIIIFSPKDPEIPPEVPSEKEINSYSVASVEGDLLSFGFGVGEFEDAIIHNYSELENFYSEFTSYYNDAYSSRYNLYDPCFDHYDIIDGCEDVETKCIYDETGEYKCAESTDTATNCIDASDANCGGMSYPSFTEDDIFNKPTNLTSQYFNEHDILVFFFSNDGICGQRFNHVRDITEGNQSVTIEIGYDGPCYSGVCNLEENIIFIELEKNSISDDDYIRYEYTNENKGNCSQDDPYPHKEKPIIYFYPEVETEINVKLGNPAALTTTYPKYNAKTGWQITARPDGTLISNGREYYGLYWEGIGNAKQKDEGFIVAGEDTAEFLEEKLEILGLNEREANEFIIYWLPKMEHNNFNYIRFATAEEIESAMPLEISPKPDATIRIMMEFKPLDEKIEIKEQKLKKVERSGYTVVEWGGSEIK